MEKEGNVEIQDAELLPASAKRMHNAVLNCNMVAANKFYTANIEYYVDIECTRHF